MYECKKSFKHHLIFEKKIKILKKKIEKTKKLPVSTGRFSPWFFYCRNFYLKTHGFIEKAFYFNKKTKITEMSN